MKKVIFVALVFVSILNANAQNTDRQNTIRTKLFPTYNSDYSYFFVRQDMRLNELMAGTEVVAFEDGAVDVRTKSFIPLYDSKKLSYIIPIYYDQYKFKGTTDAQELNVNHMFGQSVLTYRPTNKWDLLHIIEFRFKGVNDYFFKKEGNFLANFMMARYKLNKKLNIIGGGLIGIGWDQNGESYTRTRPSFAVHWKPNKYFDLMLGVPGAAMEWSAPGGVDIVVNALMDGGDVNTTGAIRKHLGQHFDITARYLREGYSELYTPSSAAPFLNTMNTQQISQYQNKYQLEFTIRPERNTVLQLIGGYGQNRDLNVLNTNNIESKIASPDGYYFGVNLQKTIQLPTK